MNNRLYGNLIFELSKPGRRGYSLPKTSSDITRCRQKCVAAKMLNCRSVTN